MWWKHLTVVLLCLTPTGVCVAQTDQTRTGSGPLVRPTRQLTSPAVAPRLGNTSLEVVSPQRLVATALTVPEQEPLPAIPPPERSPVTDPRGQLDGHAFLRVKRLASEPGLKVFACITSHSNPIPCRWRSSRACSNTASILSGGGTRQPTWMTTS